VGNLFDFPSPASGVQLDEQLLRWSLEHGLVYTLHVPILGPLIVCADPDMINVKHVTVPRNLSKSRVTYKSLRPVIRSESMVTLEGKERAAKRRSFNPGFSPSFLKTMVSTMADKLERLIACVERDVSSNQSSPMLERAQTFTSDVIVAVAFGEDWGGSGTHPARHLLNRISELSQEAALNFMLQLFGFRHKWMIRKLERTLDNELHDVLRRRLASDAVPTNERAMDICSIAIREIQNEHGGRPMSDRDIARPVEGPEPNSSANVRRPSEVHLP
jgi:cytochrome P450